MLAVTTSAEAHGFGQRYELPLPLTLYLLGAASVVALSFVVFGLFLHRVPGAHARPRIDLLATPIGRIVASPVLVLPLRIAAVCAFALTIAAGLIGGQNPYRNIAPTLVWIVWWVGLVYVSALVGDVWALLNPWQAIFDGADWLYRRLGGRSELSVQVPYPRAFGTWPACALLLAFSWIELVYPNPAVPTQIACLAIGYSILTWTGMFLFGRETWLRHGEVFTIVFGLFAKFAPTEAGNGVPKPQLLLRPFGAGLLDDQPVSASMMALVLLLLATVLYDGLIGTTEWSDFERALSAILPALGEHSRIAVRTAGLVAFWLLFLGAFVAVGAIMSVLAGRGSAVGTARSFALTLIPIAIGYHVAHYLVFLLIQGQYIVPLVSDPFGYGWNLFGTAGYRVDIAAVGARFAWYAAVGAIVIGHVAAVYLGHVKAMRVFAPRRTALRSQFPLTALMVAYTFIGLSITAEPIVERSAPAEPTAIAAIDIPADAMLPDSASGDLSTVGAGKIAKAKLTYRVLGSAFHDGTRTTAADLLYAYVFAYRWSNRRDGDVRYDPAIEAATASLRRQIAGVRLAGTDTASRTFRVGDVNFVRELFAIDVYLAVVPEQPEERAVFASPWSTLPWHLTVLMEEAVGRGWAAFSEAEAARRGVEWLDIVRSDRIKSQLASLVETFEREGYRPSALQSLVSVDDARKRWAALAAFNRTHGHFLVTNGPYRLKRWSTDSVTLEAFRDLTYPLGVGSYDAYAIPRRGFVTQVEWNGDRATLFGDVEVVDKFQRSYRLVRKSLQSLAPEVAKRAAPECRYMVVNSKGRAVLAGVARLDDNSAFKVDLDGRLPAGSYTMFAVIALAGNVMNADVRRVPVVIASKP